MKKIIKALPDFVLITVLVIAGLHFLTATIVAVAIAFIPVLAFLYHMCMTIFAPLTQAIPTIRNINPPTYNAKAFWILRITETVYAYALLLIYILL